MIWVYLFGVAAMFVIVLKALASWESFRWVRDDVDMESPGGLTYLAFVALLLAAIWPVVLSIAFVGVGLYQLAKVIVTSEGTK